MKKIIFVLITIISITFITSVKALEINDIEDFETLKNCLESSLTNVTCKLGKDIEGTKLVVTGDKIVTLNLNGNNLLLNDTFVKNDASITISNKARLSIVGEGNITTDNQNNAFLVMEKGSLDIGSKVVIENNRYYGNAIKVIGTTNELEEEKTSVKIGKNAKILANYGIAITYNGNSNSSYGVKVDVYGEINGITGNKGGAENTWNYGTIPISINGSVNKKTGNVPEINIYDGAKLVAISGTSGNVSDDDATSIYAGGYGNWNISGGTFIGDEALSIKSGNFKITGGIFTSHGTYYDPATLNNNGTEATGATISITTNKNYARDVLLNISGGSFTSEKGLALYESKTNDASALKDNQSITITNGTFNGNKGSIYADTATNFITGGTYSHDVTNYTKEEYIASKKDKNYVVKLNKNIINKDEKGNVKATIEYEKGFNHDYLLKINEINYIKTTEDKIIK